MKASIPELLMSKYLKELKLNFVPEFRFHPVRRWRFDFWLPEHRIGIEMEGGTWSGGRHVRGKGYESDLRKYNEAARMGIRVFRFTSNMVQRAEAKTFLKEFFGNQEQRR
jgi:very-short-patch-repair endonuclease